MSRYQQEMVKLKNAVLKDPFPYALGGVLLAVLNVAHFATFGSPWGVTTAFTTWGGWLCQALGLSPETWAYFKIQSNAKALAGGFWQDAG